MVSTELKPLVNDELVVWDSKSLKQIDQAKAIIMCYKRAGHLIETTDGNPMTKFNPRLEEVRVRAKIVKTPHIMKILCDKGDERLVWDSENGQEAKQAKQKFIDLLVKGYSAYSVNRDGKKNMKIEEFDVEAEELLMIPPTAKG